MKEKMTTMTPHIIAVMALVIFIVLGLACATSPEKLEQQEAKQRERLVRGFRSNMRENLIDPSRAVVEFYPDNVRRGGGLLFIREINGEPVNYEGYASSVLTGIYDCFFYLQPGENTISKVRWQSQGVVGPNVQGSAWADDLSITYNFEAGKYYKLWGEEFQYDTGMTGLSRFVKRVRLNISLLN